MTDRCDQEHESNGNESDDSLSLLRNLSARLSRGADEDMEVNDLDSQFGNKEQEREAAMEINPLKPPESGTSSGAQSAAGRADSTSQSAAKVSQCVKTPKEKALKKRNANGETLLHKACRRKDLAQVKALIQAGINVNAEDYAGWTALHEASSSGNAAVVEELLKAGANVHARSFDGVTALHDAVDAGNYQVVKLLVQYGSNAGDKTKAGLSALDMAKKDDIRELLSLRVSPVAHEQPCEARHRPPGEASSSEAQWLSRDDPAEVRSRDSRDEDGARRPGDIQPARNDPGPDDRQSETLTLVLEEVGRKQTEISAWPLKGPEDAGRYHAALVEIQKVLFEALTKQQLEKDDLAQRYRTMPEYFRQRLFKSQVVSLASRQGTVLETVQKHMRLVEAYVSTKAESPAPPPGSGEVRPRPTATPSTSKETTARGCSQSGEGSQKPVAQTAVVRSTPPPAPPAPPPLTQRKKKKKAAKKQKNSLTAAQAGSTPRHFNFQMKGNNALIQTPADDHNAHLSQLLQRGVLQPGSALKLLLKDRWHLAHLQADGSIKDAKGKSHRAPERWLESILGNNIPVGSTYAWDKVTFGDKPLSRYLLDADEDREAPQAGPEVDVQQGSAGSLPDLTPEASLRRLMKIKTIRLVGDEEMLPNAVVDRYWEALLKKDFLESEDWDAEQL